MKNKILLIFISLASLFSLSCSEKIHGLSKYNGNTYVSSTVYKIEVIEPPEPSEDIDLNDGWNNPVPITNNLYLWLYIYEGEAYFTNSTAKRKDQSFIRDFMI